MRKAKFAHSQMICVYTWGNSMLIFSYSGAIILQGPHHFAVKSNTDSFSRFTTAPMLNCCSGSIVDANLQQYLPDATALLMWLSELSSTTLLMAAKMKDAERQESSIASGWQESIRWTDRQTPMHGPFSTCLTCAVFAQQLSRPVYIGRSMGVFCQL